MSDRLPPHNLEAEQAVLGSLLIDRDAIAQVADSLKLDAFSSSQHRTIYRALLALWKSRYPADLVTVSNFLDSRDLLDEVGGTIYLSSLLAVVPTAAHIAYYANIVNEHARRRALIEVSSDLARAAYAPGDEPDYDDLLSGSRRRIGQFDPEDERADDQVAVAVDALRDTAFRRWAGEIDDRVLTGIADLDKMTGGMGKQELWVVGARPSIGKTAAMCHIARRCRSLIFSLEMPKAQIVNRLISTEAGVPYSVATSVVGDVLLRDRWLEASETIERLPMMIVDSGGMTTTKIAAITARAIAEHGVQAVFIDHMSYLADRINGNEQERVGELSRRCKAIADDCDVPVVLLSQLNREAEGRVGCMPQLSDLRSSGRIEEDAFVVGLLYRRMYYVGRGMVDPNDELDRVPGSAWERVQMIVAKNRNGEVGTANLGWEPACMKFHEVYERRSA